MCCGKAGTEIHTAGMGISTDKKFMFSCHGLMVPGYWSLQMG